MRIHHLALRTRDLDRLEAFYTQLGFERVRVQPGYSVWLRAGDAVLMLEVAEHEEPHLVATSRELIAFAVNTEERARTETLLGTMGVAIEDRTEHTLYFRDPDGRRIGVSSYELGEP